MILHFVCVYMGICLLKTEMAYTKMQYVGIKINFSVICIFQNMLHCTYIFFWCSFYNHLWNYMPGTL